MRKCIMWKLRTIMKESREGKYTCMAQRPPRSLDERLSKIYYTAAQARTVLGLDKDTFNYWVKIGKIQKRTIAGSHGLYARKDIDTLAADIEAILMMDAPEPLTFRRATLEDLEKEDILAHLVFGQPAITPEIRQARRAYLQKNKDSFWHLYDQERLVSFINIVPLRQAAYEAFRHGQRGWTFDLEDIEQFAPGHPLQCIIIDFVTTPTVPPRKRKQYAARVISELGKTLIRWGEMGIEITHVAAASATETGQAILQNAGFRVVGDSGHGRLIYELDVLSSEAKMLRGYKSSLEEWRAVQHIEPRTASEPKPEPIREETIEVVALRQRPASKSSRPPSQKEPLPDDLIPSARFANDHGIHENTVRKAIQTGRLQDERNDWILGKSTVKSAFNREQQAAFIRLYSSNEKFQQCKRENCPCHRS